MNAIAPLPSLDEAADTNTHIRVAYAHVEAAEHAAAMGRKAGDLVALADLRLRLADLSTRDSVAVARDAAIRVGAALGEDTAFARFLANHDDADEAAAPIIQELDEDEPGPDPAYVIDQIRVALATSGIEIDHSRHDSPVGIADIAGIVYGVLSTIGALR